MRGHRSRCSGSDVRERWAGRNEMNVHDVEGSQWGSRVFAVFRLA
jgi:hypothetical protein